jgi:hypothetical protein
MDVYFRKFKEFMRRFSRKSRYEKMQEGETRPTGKLIAHKLPPFFQVNVNDNVAIGEKNMIHGTGDESEGIRIADSEGQSVAADVNPNGIIDYSIKGKSRQGESGTIEVCKILIERLNQNGANWSHPIDLNTIEESEEQGVDCEACDGDLILHIQVTRVERSIWRTLSIKKEVSKNSDIRELVETIKSVIFKKSRTISSDQRKELILALDAVETPDYAFEKVIKLFREAHHSEIAALGFKGVWLVGPNEAMTYRLD